MRGRPRVAEGRGGVPGGGRPNYFGAQRCGKRGRNQDLGRHLLEGDDLVALGGKLVGRVAFLVFQLVRVNLNLVADGVFECSLQSSKEIINRNHATLFFATRFGLQLYVSF